MIRLHRRGLIYWLYTVGSEGNESRIAHTGRTDLCHLFWGSTARPLALLLLIVVLGPVVVGVMGIDHVSHNWSERKRAERWDRERRGEHVTWQPWYSPITEFVSAIYHWIKGHFCPIVVFE